jgi:DNA-binding IscR family transcriptional regulator
MEVIRTIDGPIILTHCFTEHEGQVECTQSALCPVREPLRKVHEGVLRLLTGISIADLAENDPQFPSIQAMVASIQPSMPTMPRLGSETP